MRKAQIALEFILYIMLGITVVITLSATAISFAQDARERQAQEAIADLAYSLQDELITAASVHKGYNRMIDIPDTLVPSTYYTITNTKESLTIAQVNGGSITLPTPTINGTLTKGRNIVTLHENSTLVITH